MRRRSSCTGEASCTEISRCVREHVPIRIAVGTKPGVRQRRPTSPSCILVVLVFFPVHFMNALRLPELRETRCGGLECSDLYRHLARVATFVATLVVWAATAVPKMAYDIIAGKRCFFYAKPSISLRHALLEGPDTSGGQPFAIFPTLLCRAPALFGRELNVPPLSFPVYSLEPAVAHTMFSRRATCSIHGEPNMCWCVSLHQTRAVSPALFSCNPFPRPSASRNAAGKPARHEGRRHELDQAGGLWLRDPA